MKEKTIRFFERELTIWGPLFLFCTLTMEVDLFLITVVGFYFSARWQFRGALYALVFLALTAVIRHAFFISDGHILQLGIEGSLACGFFITGLSFDEKTFFIDSLLKQIETGQATIENIEEERVKAQELTTAQQIAYQEKIAHLQKELEELQSDHSSILILNEVLRKTSARQVLENEFLLEQKKQIPLLKEEIARVEKELAWINNSDGLAQQNKELMNELNTARLDREQTHLINETLERLYVRENFKAKEADEEASVLSEQLSAAKHEVQKVVKQADEKIAGLIQQLEFMQNEIQVAREELASARNEIQRLEKEPKVVVPDPEIVEQLDYAQKKMVHLSQMEPLLKQLKKQFDEKNQVLSQTRADLFKIDTELQKVTIEKTALELNPLPKEIEEELQDLSEQIANLEEENEQLQELITMLNSSSEEASKRKKKLKTLPANSLEQNLLF